MRGPPTSIGACMAFPRRRAFSTRGRQASGHCRGAGRRKSSAENDLGRVPAAQLRYNLIGSLITDRNLNSMNGFPIKHQASKNAHLSAFCFPRLLLTSVLSLLAGLLPGCSQRSGPASLTSQNAVGICRPAYAGRAAGNAQRRGWVSLPGRGVCGLAVPVARFTRSGPRPPGDDQEAHAQRGPCLSSLARVPRDVHRRLCRVHSSALGGTCPRPACPRRCVGDACVHARGARTFSREGHVRTH